ncbi:AAA family ATPase [Colwellia sp. E2M01]|uniref:AAA family ATPase n=1 Tax=Colwellia sp. E2M01 TaxID=2841561 RepID=UPI001C0A10A7|nr:AAA family ATPase [Colwellia sp. E2M01]MBU2869837.1 AAA family ATPase [Colwellia sp. E2M01]
MTKTLIFGNSGSGKSTLAKKISTDNNIAHLDLDTIAWQVTSPPTRTPIADNKFFLEDYINKHKSWVIEGCYADLLQLLTAKADNIIFLDLPVEACIDNAKKRPWEPHKYESEAAQDANLGMLIEWIRQYTKREDTFSHKTHTALYDEFTGKKERRTTNS